MPNVSADLRFNGLAQLEKTLEELPKVLQEEIIGKALGAGGEVIRQGAAERIHSRTGATSASLRVEVQARAAGLLSSVAGAAAIGASPKRQHVLRFLEFGTKAHDIPKKRKKGSKPVSFGGKAYAKVKHPGTRPQSPLTAALGEDSAEAIRAFRDEAWRGIEAFAEKRNQETE
jgi:HK97 gp10 family phage protein